MAKQFLYIASGIFLLAAAWSLVADDLNINLPEAVPDAQARASATGPFPNTPVLVFGAGSTFGPWLVVDEQGFVWEGRTDGESEFSWDRLERQIFRSGTVPTATGSMSDLKAIFGGE